MSYSTKFNLRADGLLRIWFMPGTSVLLKLNDDNSVTIVEQKGDKLFRWYFAEGEYYTKKKSLYVVGSDGTDQEITYIATPELLEKFGR